MAKSATDAEFALRKLGELCSRISAIGKDKKVEASFEEPLSIMHETMGFDLSVLYRVSNDVDGKIIFEVVTKLDPHQRRPGLEKGQKIEISTARPDPSFINEVISFRERGVSAKNVPGPGCDLVGCIDLGEETGHAWLFGGDYIGENANVAEYEIGVCEILCGLMASVLLKLHYETLAINDSLTGLYNSRKIRAELETHLRRRRRSRAPQPFALCIGDIDHFKKINDTYGHVQGDSVLEEVGQLFRSHSRGDFDMAGRFGGEEFLILISIPDEMLALGIVERFRKAIEKHPFKRVGERGEKLEGEKLTVTMSFGVVTLDSTRTPEARAVLSAADKALYESKEKGRNRVTMGAPIIDPI